MNIEHFLVLLTRTSKACSWFSFFQIFFIFLLYDVQKMFFFSKSSFFCQKKFEAKNESGIRGFFPSMQIQSPAESSARVSRTKSDAGNFFSVSFWAQVQVLARTASWVSGTFVARVVWTCPEKEIPCSVITRERETNKKFKNKSSFPQHVTS